MLARTLNACLCSVGEHRLLRQIQNQRDAAISKITLDEQCVRLGTSGCRLVSPNRVLGPSQRGRSSITQTFVEMCPMFLALFDREQNKVIRGKRTRKSAYEHKFGGSFAYSGLQPNRRQPPVHLLFRINTEDPLVTVDLGPRITWLPLLCAIRYGACQLGYRVASDGEVVILDQKEKKAWDGFPYDDYPELLPVERIGLIKNAYNPSRPYDALFYGRIFGYNHLTSPQRTKLERFVVAKGLCDPVAEEPQEYLRTESLPYVQGPPVDDCPNPKCRNHGRRSALRTIAIFQEAEDRLERLWGPNCGGLQIIYQICRRCRAIRTTNQCT